MMGRVNHDHGQLFYSFSLEEAVPGDHLRQVFVRAAVSSLGSARERVLKSDFVFHLCAAWATRSVPMPPSAPPAFRPWSQNARWKRGIIPALHE
jgi:hypothetical protein